MKRKQRIIGGLITLGIEAVIGILSVFLFFSHYKKITTTKGIVQAYSTNVDINIETEENNTLPKKDNKIVYNGIFGQIAVVKKNNKKDIFDYSEKTTNLVKLNIKKVYIYHIVSERLENGLIDSKFANLILNQENFDNIIKDTVFLSQYSNKKITKQNIPSKDIIKVYENLIKKEKYQELVVALQNLEKMMQFKLKKTSNPDFFYQNWMETESRNYIAKSFVFDEKNQYRGNIDLVSNILDIDKNLVKSAIIGEQVRGFFTYRGVAKKMITDNFGVMRMGQGSYGIGGVKVETAYKVLERAKKNEPEIYKKHLDRVWNDEVLQTVLQDHKDYFYQTLFVGLTIKEIIHTWKTDGFDISNNPGVILTLYNIGNKTPHSNPQIGGAEIDINGQKRSFGGLGTFVYYFLQTKNS